MNSTRVSSFISSAWLLCLPSVALQRYGHAYSRPDDFTPDQYASIARLFPIFTVEKAHAANVYGNASAPAPFKTNSIAATVGTAKKIHAINASTKVLMYWNSALHYNMYECESQAKPGYYYLTPTKPNGPPFWNYSNPDFREFWVKCAVDAVRNSGGELSGLFLDGNPKLEAADAVPFWGAMVDKLRAALPDAIIIDNGFFLTPSGAELAGEDCWSHTGNSYAESMAGIPATGKRANLTNALRHLRWIANSTAAHPDRTLIGHGTSGNESTFRFGMAKYLAVTASVKNGWFLANQGYSIDGGLLTQPDAVYSAAEGCGEPVSPFKVTSEYTIRREFENGYVEFDLDKGATADVKICDSK